MIDFLIHPRSETEATRWGPWATTAFGLAAGVLMTITQTGGVLLYMYLQKWAHPENPVRIEDIAANGPALSVAFLVSAPVILGFIALAVKWSRQDFRQYLGLYWPSPRDALIGVAMLVAVLILSGASASFLDLDAPAFTSDTFGSAQEAGLLPVYVLAFVVGAPLQEEVLFRGFLYRGFAPAIGPVPAIIILSAIWAAFHVQYAWFFMGEIFVLGLAFGYLRWRSGSLFLTIGLHMAVNGLAMLTTAFMV